jgi:hypothetical protein
VGVIIELQYLFKILLYVILILTTYGVASLCYRRRYKTVNVRLGNINLFSGNGKETRITLTAIVFLSILLGFYSTICSKVPYSSDRGNYVTRFVNNWSDPWTAGLNLVADFLHLFTNDPNALFFLISFLCLFVTLLAYRMFNEEAEPQAILLMSLSTYCIYSFYLFKQAPSIAFAALSLAAVLKKKWLLGITCLTVAIAFHEAAFILLPLYIVLIGAKNRWVRILQYAVLILCVIFFSDASRIVSSFLDQWIPGLALELNNYLDETGSIIQSSNYLTVLKGFPYYLITLYALWKRPILKGKIVNYDRFLVLCVFASCMIILSAFMYWMNRFAAYCYFPMFIFAALMMKECRYRGERQLFYLLVGGSLGLITLRYLYQIYFWYGGF